MEGKMRFFRLLAAGMAGLLPALSSANGCGSPAPAGEAWQHKNGVLFKSSILNVDADGAPNSYLVDGKGLSYTCDGVAALVNGKRVTRKNDQDGWEAKCRAAWQKARESNDYSGVAIFGFETGKNKMPLIQGEGDPLPGKGFISSTSVRIPGTPERTQRQYVDATKIPYIVLSPEFVQKYKIKAGTLAVVFRPKTGTHAFGVYADGGDLGEASVKLHQDLGSNPIVQKDGVDRAKLRINDPTVTVVFPDRVARPQADAEEWVKKIQEEGSAGLDAFGGIEVLKSCAR
jgi:hypothetical protein